MNALTPRNRLLAGLPADVLAQLWPLLEPVEFRLREVVCSPDTPVRAVLFPETGWTSMLALLVDGRSAELGLVGCEGMVGVPLLLGSDRSSVEVIVQAAGTMLRLSAEALRTQIEQSSALRSRLLLYALAFQNQIAQTAACNGHHTLNQRLARWLLMAHDRAQSDTFPMTHEFLALMLCVHRPGVTLAAQLFQQSGLIQYGSGRITIIDRAQLEQAACECDSVVKREFDRLLGPVLPRG